MVKGARIEKQRCKPLGRGGWVENLVDFLPVNTYNAAASPIRMDSLPSLTSAVAPHGRKGAQARGRRSEGAVSSGGSAFALMLLRGLRIFYKEEGQR